MNISRNLIASSAGRTYLVAANRRAAPNGGIGVFDITEPSSMTHVGDVAGANVDDPEQLAFDSNRRFVAVGSVFGGYISIFDLKDPLAPFEAADYPVLFSKSLEFSPNGSYLFTGVSGSDQIYTFAVSVDGTITIVGNPAIILGGLSEGTVLAYDAQRDVLFGGSGETYSTLVSMDASTPTSLSLLDWVSSGGLSGVVRVRHDDTAELQLAASTSWFTIFDTSDTSNLVIRDALTTTALGTSTPRDFVLDTANQIAYIIDRSTLVSVDYSNPAVMVVLDTLSVGSNNQGVSYYDGHVFITAFGGAVYSVDVSDPTSMALVDTLSGLSGSYYQSAIVQT